MKIGEALKNARERKGLTQKELAEMLYVHHSLICKWEKGKREITLSALVKIEDVLEMSIYKEYI